MNPSAALATINRITRSLRVLQNHAQTGAPLASIADIESDYRFIVSGNYISFYRTYGSDIYIDRILYAHSDYTHILFGDNTSLLAFVVILCIPVAVLLKVPVQKKDSVTR